LRKFMPRGPERKPESFGEKLEKGIEKARGLLTRNEKMPSSAKALLKDRAERKKKLNDFCKDFYESVQAGKEPSAEMVSELEAMFEVAPGQEKLRGVLLFALEAFRKAPLRKDGSLLATHSLELYKKAKSLGIEDLDVHATVLLHDTMEDTDATLEDLRLLDEKIGADFSKFALVMTEKRDESEDRDMDLVKFVRQLRAAEGVPEGRKRAIVLAEELDRIDDLSDIEYLTAKLDSPEKREEALEKLAQKFAKCRFTIDRVTEGSEEDEDVENLKEVFNAVYRHQIDEYKIPEDRIEEIKAGVYESKNRELS